MPATEAERLTLTDQLAELDALEAKATPRPWKAWGMSSMWDKEGTSDVSTAVKVAFFYTSNERGMPVTFDLQFVNTLRNAYPALRAQLAAPTVEGKWVPVSERLPELRATPGDTVTRRVLVANDTDGTVSTARLHLPTGEWCHRDSNWKVTHWQHLPEPPGGETK